MKPVTGEIVELEGLRNDEALNRGLVRIPDEDVERVRAMSDDERLAYLEALTVRTELETGAVRVQPVGPLLERAKKARAARNRKRRARQGRVEQEVEPAMPEESRPNGWAALR